MAFLTAVALTCISSPQPSQAALPADLSPAPATMKMAPGLLQQLRLTRLERGILPATVGVLVQFRQPASAGLVARLDDEGVRFLRHVDGRLMERAGWYAAIASLERGLPALEREPLVHMLDRAVPGGWAPTLPVEGPYDAIHTLTGALETQPRRDPNGERTTGAGVVICDIDDGIDPFHPLFFKADGGLFVWFDENGDGVITPGVDRVDYDRDGAPDGVLQLLEAGLTDYWSGTPEGLDGLFTAGRDYLYYDVDGDGVRDVGPPSYDDASPSFGEPLFIADDVDGDGSLSPQERLVGLKTSKIKGIWRLGGEVYKRGVNLTEHYGLNDGDHGTGVSGILVGGTFGRSAVSGVAPDAELVMINRYSGGDLGDQEEPSLMAAMEWARDLGADLFVHEYGSHFAEYGDGSSSWEAVVDDFTAEGLPQVTATHNFAGFDGHAAGTVAAGASLPVALQTFAAPGYGFYLLATLRWRDGDGTDLTAQLDMPDGTLIPLVPSEGYHGTWYAGVTRDTSDRGTHMVTVLLARLNAAQTDFEPLGDSQFLLNLHSTSAADLQWRLHISDESGYSYLTSIVGLATDAGTMAHPSTADSAISVGASVGNEADDGEVAEGLRRYSGRGPRIDGDRGVDIIAPSDHYTALHRFDLGDGSPHFGLFGGTSGALPQVAGAIALLLGVEPGLSPAEVRERLSASAAEDGQTGAVPNLDWGHGRLQIHELLFAAPPQANTPPQAAGSAVEAWAGYETELDATTSSDPDDPVDRLWFRWDLDYDGTWDVEQLGEPIARLTFDTPGEQVVKLEVEDPLGFSDQVLLSFTVADGQPPQPDPEPEAPPEPSPDTGADATDSDATSSLPDGVAPSPVASDGCASGSPSIPAPWYLLIPLLALRLRRRAT